MDNQLRLEYHQSNSEKSMEEIRSYAMAKLENKEVEPNSSLGSAFNYMLKRWNSMTQFLRIPGAARELVKYSG